MNPFYHRPLPLIMLQHLRANIFGLACYTLQGDFQIHVLPFKWQFHSSAEHVILALPFLCIVVNQLVVVAALEWLDESILIRKFGPFKCCWTLCEALSSRTKNYWACAHGVDYVTMTLVTVSMWPQYLCNAFSKDESGLLLLLFLL